MAMFYGVNSENSSSFFNSMLGTNKSNNLYANLSQNLGDYNAIRNGSYRKLVNEYYKQEASSAKKTESTSNTKTETTAKRSTYLDDLLAKKTDKQTKEQKALVETESVADSAKKSADVLAKRGSDSVFKTTMQKDLASGRMKSTYDTDKIYSAVKSLVDDYNSLLKNVSDSQNSDILKQGVSLIDKVSKYEHAFEDMGISINADDTLSINETAFKKANMEDVKVAFNGSNSLSGDIYQSATDIARIAENAASSTATYDNNANYVNQLTGSLYNNYL